MMRPQRLEHKAARSEFERLGAQPELVRLDAPDMLGPPTPGHPLTARELQVLRLISERSYEQSDCQ